MCEVWRGLGRLCLGRGGGSIWWQNLKQNSVGVFFLDERWLVDNITRKKVGDGMSTLFWNDPWLIGPPLETCFSRLFELAKNKLAIVVEMYFLRWKVNGEA